MKTIKITGIIFMMSLLLQSCMADLRTKNIKKEGIILSKTEKGKLVLANTWEKQGMKQFQSHKVFSLTGEDTWHGMMGKIGKVWPDNKSNINIKFEVGSFDSQISFIDGKREGEKAGLQNWNYYEIDKNDSIKFKKTNKRLGFGLPAFHYFFEMIDRLTDAPIINYAGEKEFRNEKFDLVFCTWNSAAPNKETDQYMLWINKETGLLQYAEYTIRENYLKMPGAKTLHGSIEFDDFREVEGALIPYEQTVYIGTMPENKKRHLHQFKVTDFVFDNFELSLLKPNSSLKIGGDFKN